MKPSWDDAPEWANYVAKDANGSWHWYEMEPEWDDCFDAWVTDGRWDSCETGIGASKSLERRP